ncbi:MAG: dihydropteroate synthase [Dehalococcoidia bacterium]|nr:dihydropteroate synthase [Dehalococcoidia bacterium]
METRISSATKEVIIGDDRPTVLIGERINPAGRKKLSEALIEGNLEIVSREALAQVQAGADIIDVNVSAFNVDEVALLPQAVRAVMDTVDVPLCLDSANPEALAAALKVYKGKPLINSVTGEEHSIRRILPLVNEYRATVIGLTQDDEGVPNNADRRVAIAHKIVQRAEVVGIPREDIIIDCLAFAVGADTSSGLVTLETIRRVKAELGVNLTLGASNISFGLPDRDVINNTFVAIVIAAGVTCLIVNVAKVRPIVLAADLVLANDKRARRYIEAYRQRQKQ